MKKCFVFFSLIAFLLPLAAQTKYTDVIQQQSEGEGKVVLHQSQEIADLVNIPSPVKAAAPKAPKPVAPKPVRPQVTDSLSADSLQRMGGAKMRANGYRIQVYSGDNTRKGKNEATMMGQRVRSYFDELPVYTNFLSPHWICRVGDFRTYEEANEYLQRLRATGRFSEAVLVKSKIIVRY